MGLNKKQYKGCKFLLSSVSKNFGESAIEYIATMEINHFLDSRQFSASNFRFEASKSLSVIDQVAVLTAPP
jgi:hypothetical protein